MMIKMSQLSHAAGVTPKAIRHYEKHGFFSPKRDMGGKRIYTEEDLARLKLIMKLRSLDFGVEQIRRLLPRFRGGLFQGDANEVRALLEKNLSHVRAKRAALEDVERWLESLRGRLGNTGGPGREPRAPSESPSRKYKPFVLIDGCCDPFCGPGTCGPPEPSPNVKK